MTAQIVIDDGGGPAVGSTDNDNTFLSVVHTISNFSDTGVLSRRWTLVDKPIGSTAALSSTTTATVTMTPDVAGNYLIRLETFTDVGSTQLDDADEQVVGVRLPTPYDWAVPAAGETNQQNATRGWAQSREEAIRDVHAFMNSGVPQLPGAIDRTLDGGDPETVFGGFVLDATGFPSSALKLRIVGSLTVAGAGDAVLRLYDLGAVGSSPAAGVLRAEVQIDNVDAGGVLVRDQALTPVASPGVNTDEVATERRRYELRGEIVGGAAGDTFRILQGSIALEG